MLTGSFGHGGARLQPLATAPGIPGVRPEAVSPGHPGRAAWPGQARHARPIRTARMAITSSNSIRVNADPMTRPGVVFLRHEGEQSSRSLAQ